MNPIGGETGAAAVGSANAANPAPPTTTDTEYYLCGIAFPATHDLLKNQNVFIADTADTAHMTAHDNGLINKRESDGMTTWGNGETNKTKIIGDLPVTICDKTGNKLSHATLMDVSFIPDSVCNLFSLTKMTENGWRLHGDDDSIWINKGNMEVCFDIKIKIPNGALFCAYLKRNFEYAAPFVNDTPTLTNRVWNQLAICQPTGFLPDQLVQPTGFTG
jgi:hypothetical protein